MRALDLFRGAGGWSLAARRLGIDDLGVEIMPEANATAGAAGFATVGHDVWTFDPPSSVDGLIASPPCQTFSQAGKGEGRKALDQVLHLVERRTFIDRDRLRATPGDERTALVLTPLHFIYNGTYSWVALEQVPTVLPVWEAYTDVLREWGYYVWTGLLHAEQYGVPQTRKRAFLIASLDHEVGPPEPTHSRYYPRNPEKLDPGVKKWVSMAEALGWDTEWYLEEAYRVNDQSGVPYDPAWPLHRPALSVAGRDIIPHPGANANRFNGRSKSRNDGVRVSVKEAGILQSFPANYPWQGGKSKQYLQVGNAVPPLLAEAVLSKVVA